MATPKKIGAHAQVSYRMVDPKELTLNPNNQRDYDPQDPSMVSLRQSLAAQGVLTALEIYEDGVVHDGNRRLFNINILLGEGVWASTVPAIIVPRPENEVEATIARLNKNEARQFSPLEQARAFATLRDGGLNNSQIAAKTPFTSMHVGNMLTLHDASDDVRAAVKARQVSATLAFEVIRKHGEGVLIEAVALAVEQGRERATLRHVEAVVASKVEPAPAPTVDTPVADATDAADATVTDATVADATDATVADATDATVTDATVTDATVTDATVTDATVTDATDATDAPFDLDATPPAPPATTDEQEIVIADATPTPGTTSTPAQPVTARTIALRVAPTLQDLLSAITGGTKAEKMEALLNAKEELSVFVKNATALGLLKD